MKFATTGVLKIILDKQGQSYLVLDIPKSEYVESALFSLSEKGLDSWITNRDTRDGTHFHLTVLSVMEWQKCLKNETLKWQTLAIAAHNGTKAYSVDPMGIGHGQSPKTAAQAYFVVAQCEALQALRSELQLSPKNFHITLAFEPKDIFDVSKGVDSIVIHNDALRANDSSPTM